MSPEWVTAASELVTALAVIVGGIWAIHTYRRANRREAARWMQQVFDRFQLGHEFDRGKDLLDFAYAAVVEPVHARMVFGGNEALDPEERADSVHVDRVLNYLEHLLYLEDEGHVSPQDIRAYFGYWMGLLESPERGALRRYCARFGYDRLATHTGAALQSSEYVVVYGTLMSGQSGRSEVGFDESCRRIGDVTVPGELYHLGDFPGLIPGKDEVEGEIYEIVDESVVARLDEHEEWRPRSPGRSLFRRTTVPVRLPSGREVDAWIYVYARDVDGARRIESGSWAADGREAPEAPAPAVSGTRAAGRGPS